MIFGQKQKRLTSLENKFKEKYPIESLRIFLMLDGSIHLDSIRLEKDARGKGMGTEIVKQIVSYAKSLGRPVTLHPVPQPGFEKRLPNFYKRMGFEPKPRGRNWINKNL